MLERVTKMLTGSARAKKWDVSFADAPWLDRDNSDQELQRRVSAGRYTEEQARMLEKWRRDGYAILPGAVDSSSIDQMQADLDGIWTVSEAISGLTVSGAKVTPSDPVAVPHERLTELALQERSRIRDHSRWRVHGFFQHSAAARSIFKNERLRATASLILDFPAVPTYSINFMYGSQQELHQDGMVFAIVPPSFLIGAWIACEDIEAESGPLVYYPGSHREPVFPAFAANYPQTMLKTCAKETTQAYHDHLDDIAKRYERRTFLARKGDVLLWHALIIHGGEKHRRDGLTRRSYVVHYTGEGTDRIGELVGPFNW